MIYLLLYVDDMLIASRSMVRIKELKTELSREFDMKDLGNAQRILGMEISRDKKRRELRSLRRSTSRRSSLDLEWRKLNRLALH